MKANPTASKYPQHLATVLAVILFFKIAGYFTVSENVLITRVFKVLVRMGMTGLTLLLLHRLARRGAVLSFTTVHPLVPGLYIAYLLLGFASLMWSGNPGYSLLQIVMNSESLVFAWLLACTLLAARQCYPNYNLRLSGLVAHAIVAIMVVFVVGMYALPDQFFRLTRGGEEARLGGYFMNPNELGMLAVVGVACLCLEWRHRTRKLALWAMAGLLFYALLMTGSRSSLIAAMLVLAWHVLTQGTAKMKTALVVGALIGVPLVVPVLFIKGGDVEEVLSMTGRLPFWKALITEGLPQSPWVGFGYMRIAWTETFQSVHTYAGKMTHNTFIQVLMNLGFVGFLLVVLQMACTLQAVCSQEAARHRPLVIGWAIPLLINSFTEFGIFGEANFGILFYQILLWQLSARTHQGRTRLERLHQQKHLPHGYTQ